MITAVNRLPINVPRAAERLRIRQFLSHIMAPRILRSSLQHSAAIPSSFLEHARLKILKHALNRRLRHAPEKYRPHFAVMLAVAHRASRQAGVHVLTKLSGLFV